MKNQINRFIFKDLNFTYQLNSTSNSDNVSYDYSPAFSTGSEWVNSGEPIIFFDSQSNTANFQFGVSVMVV
jgi:hypothetical protein